MKYNDNHVRDFEGAKGSCEVCGLDIILDWQDRPTHPMDNTWIVKCPHCESSVRCYQLPNKVCTRQVVVCAVY